MNLIALIIDTIFDVGFVLFIIFAITAIGYVLIDCYKVILKE